jgi:glutamine amidotransferase
MIAIIDYDTGNLRSVENALGRLGAEYVVTADHETIRRAERVVLPGVGEASSAMAKLRARRLDTLIPTLTQPVLGICIGLQLMCLASEENDTECMGIFDAHVRRFVPSPTLKVPHMGWNRIEKLQGGLFAGIDEGSSVYYVHSYAPELCRQTIATTDYGGAFSAAIGRDNFFGTQFHPEKSGAIGQQILKNFLEL